MYTYVYIHVCIYIHISIICLYPFMFKCMSIYTYRYARMHDPPTSLSVERVRSRSSLPPTPINKSASQSRIQPAHQARPDRVKLPSFES